VELRQVRYFVEIARMGSFGRAADELHVAKSALSKQIRQLEDELGAQLLLRGGGRREVSLTEAGEAFMEDAVTIVKAMEDGRDRVRTLAGPVSGHLTMVVQRGYESWAGWEFIVTEFRRQHPGLQLKLRSGESYDEMFEDLTSGEADLATMAVIEVPVAPGVVVEVLHTERIFLVMPPRHRLARRDRVALDELRDENWVLPPLERGLVAAATESLGYSPRVEVEALTQAMMRSLILAGEGISILSESEIEYFRPAAIAELTAPALTCSVCVAYRSAYRNAATRAARDYFRSVFAPDAAAAEPASETA
jgi:LysR family transcriptional activator of glutamate synthase operon